MTVTRRPYAPRMPLEQRREQLLDAAMVVITRDGYSALSVEAVAREADVTRPVVYSAFEGLQDLLSTLLDRQEQRALEQLTKALPPVIALADPAEYAAKSVRRLVRTVADDPMTWRPILLAPTGMPPEVHERIAKDRERIRESLAMLIETGLAFMGGPKLDAQIISHMMLAMAEHFGRLVLESPDDFDVDRLAETIKKLVVGMSPMGG